jgi:hypothetical protein
MLNVLIHQDILHMFLYHNLHKYQISILMNEHNQLMHEFHLENVDYQVVMYHPKQINTSYIHLFSFEKFTAARV